MDNKEKHVIEHNLDFYHIESDIFEPRELLLERSLYIIANYNDKIDFEIINQKSRIISNTKYLNCTY